MIEVKHRFHGHASLNYLHSKGRVVRAKGMGLKYVDNPKRSKYRAAVIVSKKVHKSAVVRNRIRRRVYECIRLNVAPDQKVDFAFMIYTDAVAEMSADALKTLVTGLLLKAKIT